MNNDVIQRAERAHFRIPFANCPSSSLSRVERHHERDYAVLRNCNGVLAVYRVLNTGKLKRLRRWPASFN